MFNVVIQFGSIMAVVVIYFHKLNPFSPTKTQKQKMMTIQLWIKVIIGTLPAMIVGSDTSKMNCTIGAVVFQDVLLSICKDNLST